MLALIVDDSGASRARLRMMLRGCGFETVEAGHGLEGLERLADRDDVSVALVDWHMPEMDGLAFVKALRQDRRHADLPVMMVTAEMNPQNIARALMVGADEYAVKPLDEEALRAKLCILGLSEAR